MADWKTIAIVNNAIGAMDRLQILDELENGEYNSDEYESLVRRYLFYFFEDKNAIKIMLEKFRQNIIK